MIQVKPYFDDVPPIMLEDEYKSLLIALLEKVGKGEVWKSADIKGYAPKEVKQKLIEIFNGKCAFCERKESGYHPDTEHFRPKSSYYWLSYEWSNFLLSCHKCNRDKKRSKFPLVDKSKQINKPPYDSSGVFNHKSCHILSDILKEEANLLLHPAIDNPKKHLSFFPSGAIKGLTEKGSKSIDVYGLDSKELRKDRKKIVDDIRLDIAEEYLKNSIPTDNEIRAEVQKVIRRRLIRPLENANNEGFIAFITYILENFEEVIIENTDYGLFMPNKEIMRLAAREILDKNSRILQKY
jgi:uncharacterized protein (TIGR02646 family)